LQQPGWAASVVVTPGSRPVLQHISPDTRQFVLLPIDQSGAVRLSQERIAFLGLPQKLDPTRALTRRLHTRNAIGFPFKVPAEPERARNAIFEAMPAYLMLSTDPPRSYSRYWLPLADLQGLGLDLPNTLDLILQTIGKSDHRSDEDTRIVIDVDAGIGRDLLVDLRARVERAAGREPLGLERAFAEADIQPSEETAALFRLAANRMLQQKPGLDNGRISTRLVLFGLLLAPVRPFHESWSASWAKGSPEAFAELAGRYFRDFPRGSADSPPLPPVIFSRECLALLSLARERAAGEPLALLHIADALIEQAERDTRQQTSSRRVMAAAEVDPTALRAAFSAAVAGRTAAAQGAMQPSGPSEPPSPAVADHPPQPRDFYTAPIDDRPNWHSDVLRAKAEANALARIVALRDTQAPLAIGIFGDWGAGKSTFMESIERIVGELQGKEPYCSKIVQIRFNAWHYIETNLWASLVSHIFTELDHNLRGDEKIGDRVTELYERLTTAQRMQVETARQVIASKHALDEARALARQALASPSVDASLGIGSLVREALETFYANLSPEDQQKLDRAARVLDISKGVEALQRADEALRKGQALVARGRLVLGELGRSWKEGDRAPLIWGAALLLSFILAVLLGKTIASHLGERFGWLGGIGTVLLAVTAALSRLQRVAGGVLGLFERAYRNREEARQVAVAAAERAVAARQTQLAEAVAALRSATPFSRITQFIRDKAADETYAKHLGLVAMIRRDFETLTQCIVEEKTLAEAAPTLSKEDRKAVEEAQKIAKGNQPAGQSDDAKKDGAETVDSALKPYGRIVLYIDDLDRCTTEKVVEVLQAVHLLLAFKLFIVVVAVDYRWMRGALAQAYGGQIKVADDGGRSATAADYLEKIFQIPYWVRRLDRDTSGLFLADLIKQTREKKPPRARSETEKTAAPSASGSAVPPLGPLGTQTPAQPPGNDTSAPPPPAPPDSARQPSAAEHLGPAAGASRVAGREALPSAPAPTPIEISGEEEELLCELARYAGRTPRQLKRFFNVYRVLKASSDGAEMPWRAVIPLLAVATAAPDRFGELSLAFNRASDLGVLKKALESCGAFERGGLAPELGFMDGAVTLDQLKQQAPLVARFSFFEQDWSRGRPQSRRQPERISAGL
jgi:hypothetical protein